MKLGSRVFALINQDIFSLNITGKYVAVRNTLHKQKATLIYKLTIGSIYHKFRQTISINLSCLTENNTCGRGAFFL